MKWIAQRRALLVWLAIATAVAVGAVAWIGRARSAGAAVGGPLVGPPPAPPAGDDLRLGTFNVDGGQGTDGKVDLARTARCLQRLDVIGLEEVHGGWGDPPDQARPLGDLLHLPHLYVPAERRWGRDWFGNAFFTDLPVHRWQRVVLPSTGLHAKRNFLLSNLDWHGRTLNVVTTHVDFKGNGDEQLADVTRAFLAQPLPAVLMGDLNHPASSPQIKALLATSGVEEAVGRVLDPVPGRVDWIFLRGLRTVDAGSVDLGASDHPAYWAEVRLRSPATTRSTTSTATGAR